VANKEIIKQITLEAIDTYNQWNRSVRKAIACELYCKIKKGDLIINSPVFKGIVDTGITKENRKEVTKRIGDIVRVVVSRDKDLQERIKLIFKKQMPISD
jgi:hypothetical protein